MAGHVRGAEAKPEYMVSMIGKDKRGVVLEPERSFLASGLGKELRRLRHSAGLTLEEVAQLCGMHPDTVRHFEMGRRRPTIHALGALARILAPADQENAVMAELVTLAGDSARTGAERKRYLANNLRTRNAMVQMDRDRERLRKLADAHTAKGKPVPAHIADTLAAFTEHMEALMRRLLPELPEASGGTVPAGPRFGQYRPPSNQRELLAWLQDNNHTTQTRSTK